MAKYAINDTTLAAIADAIREKTGITDPVAVSEMATKILTIITGVDTSDATATAADMASGVTAYVDGEKVTGNVPVTDAQAVLAKEITGLSGNSTHAFLNVEMAENHLLRSGAQFRALALYSAFGDATAADVAAGKTFTSAAGLKVTGTAESGGPTTVYASATTPASQNKIVFTFSDLPISSMEDVTAIYINAANVVTSQYIKNIHAVRTNELNIVYAFLSESTLRSHIANLSTDCVNISGNTLVVDTSTVSYLGMFDTSNIYFATLIY